MNLRLCERLNAVFDRVFGPPAGLPDPTHSWEGWATATTTTVAGTGQLTIFCGLCGDAYEAGSGSWAFRPECPPCRRAKTIERDHERANWRRRRDALIAAERRADGA